MTQAQSYEAWRITYQSDEQAARSAFDTAEMLRQELLVARTAITSLERDVSQALTERDDATDFIDKILDEVLGQDRHEWTSAYDWDDALADVEAKMAALKSGKCLHQIAEPAAQGLDAHGCDMFWVADDPDGQHDTLHEAVVRALEDGGIQSDGTVEIQCAKSIPNILVRISGITPFAFEIVPDAALAEGGAA